MVEQRRVGRSGGARFHGPATRFWLIGALVAAMVLAAGAPITPAYAIAHGEAVADGRYRFAVKLTMIGIPTAGSRRNSFCSGGLISPHWVLTAGHCFRDAHDRRVSRPVADRTIATVGRAALSGGPGVDATVIEVRQQGSADVALARLDRAVVDITPLKVSRSVPRVGEKLRLAGYGLTTDTARRTPRRLQTGRFQVTSVGSQEMGIAGVAPRMDTSPCKYDSGGPYFAERPGGAAVVAVVSHGPACPHRGPDIGSRVDTVAAWILSVIATDLRSRPSASPPRPPVPSGAAAQPARRQPSFSAYSHPLLLAAVLPATLATALVFLARRRGHRRGVHRR